MFFRMYNDLDSSKQKLLEGDKKSSVDDPAIAPPTRLVKTSKATLSRARPPSTTSTLSNSSRYVIVLYQGQNRQRLLARYWSPERLVILHGLFKPKCFSKF